MNNNNFDEPFDPWKPQNSSSNAIQFPRQDRLPSPTALMNALLPQRASSDFDLDSLTRELWQNAAIADSNPLRTTLQNFELHFLPQLSANDGQQRAWQQWLDSLNPDGSCALHIAACFGQKENCWLLLSHGASVDIKDKRTPVYPFDSKLIRFFVRWVDAFGLGHE